MDLWSLSIKPVYNMYKLWDFTGQLTWCQWGSFSNLESKIPRNVVLSSVKGITEHKEYFVAEINEVSDSMWNTVTFKNNLQKHIEHTVLSVAEVVTPVMKRWMLQPSKQAL